MAAAHRAPLPIALLVLVVLADVLRPLGHGHGVGGPQRERIDRTGGPTPTVRAMAVAGAGGLTPHDEPDRATQAPPVVCVLECPSRQVPPGRTRGCQSGGRDPRRAAGR